MRARIDLKVIHRLNTTYADLRPAAKDASVTVDLGLEVAVPSVSSVATPPMPLMIASPMPWVDELVSVVGTEAVLLVIVAGMEPFRRLVARRLSSATDVV